MSRLWDRERKGLRTPKRLDILRRVTRQVVSERAELKQKENHGRLCSAVFARLRQGGYFSAERSFFKRMSTPKHLTCSFVRNRSVRVRRIWNEKEFFYKGNRAKNFTNANYHWTREDIVKFATERSIPIWMWILIVLGGFFILRKLLK